MTCNCECCRKTRVIERDLQRLLSRLGALECDEHVDPRLERLAKLEQEFSDREPGERARIIRQRMRLSKTTYYRLRSMLLQSHEFDVAGGTGAW